MFGRRRDRDRRSAQHIAQHAAADPRERDRAAYSKRGRRLPGEQAVPSYTPSIAARSIDGHLLRTGQEVYAWYRLAPQRWSFRSDSQRQDLIAAIAGQYAELQGRWMHLRVTTRPYPIRMWAEAHVHNAVKRLPDTPGTLSFDDYMVGEQQQLMGRSMAEKEVYLGVQVQTRNMMDRAVERAAPVLRKVFPDAVDAELVALDSEVEHLDQVIGSAGLEGRPATAEEMSWLMHRSCSLGLPAPRNMPAVPGAAWEPEDLASFTDAADFHQEPYSPTVTVRGRTGSNAGIKRHVAVLTVGLMHGLQIPEVDDPWVQRADRLPASVEWSARIYVRRPEEVSGELSRQMSKVRSQVRHYTDEHELEPPQSLARQAGRVLEIDDEMTSGFTALGTGCAAGGGSRSAARPSARRCAWPSRCWSSTSRRSRSSTPRPSTRSPASSSPVSRCPTAPTCVAAACCGRRVRFPPPRPRSATGAGSSWARPSRPRAARSRGTRGWRRSSGTPRA